MNFNEKLIDLRKTKGMSQEELGAELKVSRQTISKWESGQSYPDFQRLVLLSDYFGLTLDELVKDIDVQEVRDKNISNEKINSIYNDVNTAKTFVKWYLISRALLPDSRQPSPSCASTHPAANSKSCSADFIFTSCPLRCRTQKTPSKRAKR